MAIRFPSSLGRIIQKGFTLIEMLVVIGIFAVVATILLYNYSDFSTNVSVRNLAEDIGLSVRKAQIYATGVHTVTGVNGMVMSDTLPAYGVSFSVDKTGQRTYDPTVQNFVLFADAAPNNDKVTSNSYDNNGTCGIPGLGQECVESFSFSGGDTIASLCTDVPVPDTCMTPETGGTVNIIFHRPNPDAVICTSTVGCTSRKASYLKVTVQSAKGIRRMVTIWNTGQVSIN